MNRRFKALGALFLLGTQVATEPHIKKTHAVLLGKTCDVINKHVATANWRIDVQGDIPSIAVDAVREADALSTTVHLTQQHTSMPPQKLGELIADITFTISSNAVKEEKSCGGMPNKNDRLQIKMEIPSPIPPSSNLLGFNM